jgi:iron complex outermembrane receptor protein
MPRSPTFLDLRSMLSALLIVVLLCPADLWGQQPGAITGRVVNASGEPAVDAEVRVLALGLRVPVGESGQFTFTPVPPGDHLLEASSPRYGQSVDRVEVRDGQTLTITLELDPLFQLDELVVSAGPLPVRRSETYQPTSALTGWDLVRDAEASLGETLAEAPGVTASYNGPGSSRPIIRGLGGDRVRILEAGVGSGDVSNQGPDHAGAIEPMAAERIEIVRGPATLLYGSGAVGGVVNVIDNRIPREMPDAPVTGSIMGLGASVSEEFTGALELNGGGGAWAWHASGLRRRTDDYAIPGFAEHQHEDEEEGHEEEGHEEDEEPFGILENSAIETDRLALGVSWVGDQGYLGLSVSGMNNDYGVPGHGHHGHEEELPGLPGGEEGEEEEGVVIGLEQRRFDAEGLARFSSGSVQTVKGRFGYSDYEHTEFEGEEIGTRFTNEQWEGRLEVNHSLVEFSPGSVGIQLGSRSFEAFGEEAFVPPSDNLTWAMFGFQEFGEDEIHFQVGARLEGQRAEEKVQGRERNETGLSFSLGGNWSIEEDVSLALTASRSQKIPSIEELFADGPHAATFAYEIGDPNLEIETANALDLTLHFGRGLVRVEASAFVTAFSNFIYQEMTGDEEDELPVLLARQADATFMGGEGSVEFDILHQGDHHVLVEGWGDFVRAELSDSDQPLPRIPPFRVGTRLRYIGGTLRADLGVTKVRTQDRVGVMEEETDGYALVDMSVGYRLFRGATTHDIVLRGTNLSNQEARNHTSFLKELVPLPGRDLRIMYRIYF